MRPYTRNKISFAFTWLAIRGESAGDTGDDYLLHIRRSFNDLQRLGVPIETFCRIFRGETVRTIDLHALIGGMDGGLGCRQFC